MTTIVYPGLVSGDAWARIDKRVLTHTNLCDGAKVLYMYLVGFRPGKPVNDEYLMKALDISKATLFRRKAELYEADLVKVVQLGPRVHMMFVGTTGRPASEIASNWEKENNEEC